MLEALNLKNNAETRYRCQVSVYRTIGPLVIGCSWSAVLGLIIFILVGNDNIHASLDEFEIRLAPTTGFHGSREGYDGKYGVSAFSRLFFICFFPYLQVTKTCMRAWRSYKFG